MSATAKPQFRFWFRRAVADPDGYYLTRWDIAVPIQIVASNEREAYEKVRTLSGEPPEHRKWTFTLGEIQEEARADA